MEHVETGLFLLLLALGFIFTFFAFKSVGNVKGILHIVAMALFGIMSVINLSGLEVAATSQEATVLLNQSNGALIPVLINNTDTFIAGGEGSAYVGWVWTGLMSMNLILFVKDVWKAD